MVGRKKYILLFFQVEDSTDSGTETDDETGGPDDDLTGRRNKIHTVRPYFPFIIRPTG